ncbi:MAG: DUF2523 family protein [Methylococcales bacterium]|nr:DUF2523 family protein [Methylococcales bacterium]
MNLVFSGLLQFLSVLGFGFISYLGFSQMIDDLTEIVISNWQGNSASNILSLLDMAGFTDALGYCLSAVSTKAALVQTKKLIPGRR